MVDAHAHLTDLGWGWSDKGNTSVPPRLSEYLQSGPGRDVEFFIQGGVDPDEWARQDVLARQFSRRIGQVYGYHPWWVAGLDETDRVRRQEALAVLKSRQGSTVALGEIGLYRDGSLGALGSKDFTIEIRLS